MKPELSHPTDFPRRRYRHGHKKAGWASPEYATWNAMRARCNSPSNPNYHKYGGRGIKVCERWNDFVAFLEDMGWRPSIAHSLERIDNNGDYTPDNCVWATAKQQANNRRSNRFITFAGETKTLAQWADATGVRVSTLHSRLKSGWKLEDALSSAPLPRRVIK